MKKVLKIIFGISFLFYLFVLVMLLFLEAGGYRYAADMPFFEYARTSSNIIPFQTIGTYILALFTDSMNTDIPVKNLIGNLFILFPMGMYLPFFLKKIKTTGSFFLIMVVMSLFIEITQVVTRRGTFDIDDCILYVSGALIGFAIWKTKAVQAFIGPS